MRRLVFVSFDSAGVTQSAAGTPSPADPAASGPDSGSRTIAGLAVPWDSPAWSGGSGGPLKVAFRRGSFPTGVPVTVARDHQEHQLVGVTTKMTETDQGLEVELRISDTQAGTELLTLARDGVITGLSVGAYIDAAEEHADGSLTVTQASWRELSLTAWPANDASRISHVSQSSKEGSTMTTTTDAPAPVEQAAPPTPTPAPAPVVQQAGPVPVPAAPQTSATTTAPRVVQTAGEFLTEYVRASLSQDWDTFRRVTQADPTVVADQTTATLNGLLPTPILGPVINDRTAIRPVWNSLTSRTMPARGKTFERPKITSHTAVGAQTAEKALLPSAPMTVETDTVTKTTRGGTLDVSFQAIDWTEPAVMSLLVEDFADSYVLDTETLAVAALAKAATDSAQAFTADPEDPKSVVKAFYAAAAKIKPAFRLFPDTIWASLDMWAELGSLTDKNGRPLFPQVAPQNADGASAGITEARMNLLGCPIVVGDDLAPGTIVLGNSKGIETYEQIKGMIQALNVTQLGMDLAYYGYVGGPYTVNPKAFAKISLVTPPPASSK